MTFFEFFANDNETGMPTETTFEFHKVDWKGGTVYMYADVSDLHPIKTIEV